jgi:hypothetical protein
MCGMPTMPQFSVSTYIYATLGAIVLALGFYCSHLSDSNDSLKADNTRISQAYNGKVTALTQCSEATEKFAEKESKLSDDAKKAVEIAKVEAVKDYKAANSILFRKPKDPLITIENTKYYGGPDTTVQLKDYLATQDLFNELIDANVKVEVQK